MELFNHWFCDKILVTTPEGDTILFPCYRWLAPNEKLVLRPAKALLVSPDNKTERQELLKKQQDTYRIFRLKLIGLTNSRGLWDSMEKLKAILCGRRNKTLEYVREHWKEDWFFGYQFLNGINPMVIKCCEKLPRNFPVTEEMVRGLLGKSTLEAEIKKRNIFLCDYKMLDGLDGNKLKNKQFFLTAPLVLLHLNHENKMLPIAIQLRQEAGPENPIFLPTDPKHDWLLAKIFVRAAEFSVHELDFHLLRTHLLSEVFTVATLRNLPSQHPLYKLLFPHTRYTLHINIMARNQLISEDGVFARHTGIGGEMTMGKFLKRATASLTYSSLCLPDNISERGLEDVPNYYYRDDGMELWNIIYKYVKGVLQHYYTSDGVVQKDTELQSWIREIFSKGFLGIEETGIPGSFQTVSDLIKFVTMVIFTASAQHAAVNNGQFEYGGWMPNYPTALRKAPPKEKGQTTMDTILETLPDVGTTVNGMAVLELLSTKSTDHYPLGYFPEDLFDEKVPCDLIEDFQKNLKKLSVCIEQRNKNLELPYTYLNPENVDNSVAI
ncbi:polyunsaturated fatty acid lipoxygenase ALOX15B-like [Alosa pseudoharengus]|uniref:polyunsaturated fatty acid lipoxygenase ALOX15B-like n=1 Tax=Alosa pseudoharengus TaxID=34774 RepID=UPI003F88CCDF